MMKFVVNLATCSAITTVVSIIYIWLSDKLKNVWSAKVRCFLWVFIIIGFLTPFKPQIFTPAYEVILDAQPVSKVSDINYNALNYFHINDTKMNFFVILFAVWLLGFIICTLRYVIKQHQFQHYVRRMSTPCDSGLFTVAKAVAGEMGIDRFEVHILPDVSTPMMTGFHIPNVILPDSNYSEDELRLIIKHELTHFKRHDLIFKFFILLCGAVHWFNPFFAYIANKIDEVCELACDETVIAGEEKEGRKLYCKSILSAVTVQTQEKTLKPAMASDFGNPKHDLQHRLMMIIGSHKKKKLGFICAIVILLVAFSGTVFGVTFFEAETSDLSWTTVVTTTVVYQEGEEPTSVSAAATDSLFETTTVADTSYDEGVSGETTTFNYIDVTALDQATTAPEIP